MQEPHSEKGNRKAEGNFDHRRLTEEARGAIERIRSLVVKRMLQAIRSARGE